VRDSLCRRRRRRRRRRQSMSSWREENTTAFFFIVLFSGAKETLFKKILHGLEYFKKGGPLFLPRIF
jgi:hypothetical protein